MTEEGTSSSTNNLAVNEISSGEEYVGRHRMMAVISRLNQEIKFMEEDLQELENQGASSSACREMVLYVENKPDGLLPVTKGPTNSSWDRWFQGSYSSRRHKWWSHKRSEFL